MSYILLIIGQRGPMEHLFQTLQAIAQVGFSPQPDDKALLVKTPLTYVIEHKVILAPN